MAVELSRLARPSDWVKVGALRGALVGMLLPPLYGVGLYVFRSFESAEPYQGQTSVSYQNTAGGAWGYALISVLYIGILLSIASTAVASVGLVVGSAIGALGRGFDALSGRRVPPTSVAVAVIVVVAAAARVVPIGGPLGRLDIDPWLLLFAGPAVVGILSLLVLPLVRPPAAQSAVPVPAVLSGPACESVPTDGSVS